MKRTVMIAAVVALTVPTTMSARADKSAQVLAEARKAIGGEDRLNAVQTIVATGKSQRQMGQTQMSGDIEIAIALPDRYLRTQVDSIMGASVTREQGFSGGALLERSVAPPGATVMFRGPDADGDPERAKQMRLQAQKNELTRLLVAWLLTAPAYSQGQFSYAGEAESPDGKADALELKGPDGLALRVFVDKKTRRPLMITYQGRARVIRTQTMTAGQRPPAGGHGEVEATPPPLTEMQWFVDDFREVGGLWLPHRLVQAADGKTIEEWEFSKIALNQPIKDDKFKG
ncbi:MAG: hypothetical protein ACRD09_09750 [Vicinamibacterales bacterium]